MGNYKTMFDDVKITSTGQAVIDYPDFSASDANKNNKFSKTCLKEQKDNACNPTSGPSGPVWYNISLND